MANNLQSFRAAPQSHLSQAVRPGGIPRSPALQSLPHASIKPNVPSIRNNFSFKTNPENLIKLPNLAVRGSYNAPNVTSPISLHQGA